MDTVGELKFSPQLEQALAEVIPSDDLFNAPDFDPIAFINKQFPTEQDLTENGKLDAVISSLDKKITHISRNITEQVQEHSLQRSRSKAAIEEATTSIKELFAKINGIKEKVQPKLVSSVKLAFCCYFRLDCALVTQRCKWSTRFCQARESESMVNEITRDIKALDCAKGYQFVSVVYSSCSSRIDSSQNSLLSLVRHLEKSIKALRNLHSLVLCVNDLGERIRLRDYKYGVRGCFICVCMCVCFAIFSMMELVVRN